MAHELKARANRTRQVLFGKYDQLNALWAEAEKRIVQQHIPQTVYYCHKRLGQGPLHEDPPFLACYIGLAKIKGEWRICVGSVWEDHDEEPDWTPITDCSIEVRVELAEHLAALQLAAVESAEKFVPKVDEAISRLSELLGVPADDEHLKELLAERAKLNGRPKK